MNSSDKITPPGQTSSESSNSPASSDSSESPVSTGETSHWIKRRVNRLQFDFET